jgi:hypothetical protein
MRNPVRQKGCLMLKRLFPLAAALATLLLSACAPALTPTASPTPFPPTATPAPAPSATPRPATPTTTVTAAAQESLFPPVGVDEWQKGPADARITIIEYSDYQ